MNTLSSDRLILRNFKNEDFSDVLTLAIIVNMRQFGTGMDLITVKSLIFGVIGLFNMAKKY
jgi:hypothetical protein